MGEWKLGSQKCPCFGSSFFVDLDVLILSVSLFDNIDWFHRHPFAKMMNSGWKVNRTKLNKGRPWYTNVCFLNNCWNIHCISGAWEQRSLKRKCPRIFYRNEHPLQQRNSTVKYLSIKTTIHIEKWDSLAFDSVELVKLNANNASCDSRCSISTLCIAFDLHSLRIQLTTMLSRRKQKVNSSGCLLNRNKYLMTFSEWHKRMMKRGWSNDEIWKFIFRLLFVYISSQQKKTLTWSNDSNECYHFSLSHLSAAPFFSFSSSFSPISSHSFVLNGIFDMNFECFSARKKRTK